MEYVLLLVIVVAVVVGIGKGFGTLNEYLGRYIGDYTVCLMEYGELPSLGIQDAELDRHTGGTGKKCNQKYAAFSFVDGRPSNSSGSGGNSAKGGSSGGNSNSANSSQNNSNGANANNGSTAANKNGSGSDQGSDSTNGGLDKLDGKGGNKPKATPLQPGVKASGYGTLDSGSGDAEKVRVIDEDADGEGKRKKQKNKNYSSSHYAYDNAKYHAITGKMQQELEKRYKKSTRTPSSSVRTLLTSDNGFGPFTKPFIPQTFKKAKIQEEDSSGFSFGYFLRWILIAGMVIAIIIFFGGQIMNYSNSQD